LLVLIYFCLNQLKQQQQRYRAKLAKVNQVHNEIMGKASAKYQKQVDKARMHMAELQKAKKVFELEKQGLEEKLKEAQERQDSQLLKDHTTAVAAVATAAELAGKKQGEKKGKEEGRREAEQEWREQLRKCRAEHQLQLDMLQDELSSHRGQISTLQELETSSLALFFFSVLVSNHFMLLFVHFA